MPTPEQIAASKKRNRERHGEAGMQAILGHSRKKPPHAAPKPPKVKSKRKPKGDPAA